MPANSAVAGSAVLDPLLSQQPYFDGLRKAHVAQQPEHKDWPVHPRQVREAQRRAKGGYGSHIESLGGAADA
jgi:hypothetical protein